MAKKTPVVKNPAELFDPHLLINLPVEILVLAFGYLDDVLPIVKTCKFFKTVVYEDNSLQQKFISKPKEIIKNIHNIRAMATTSDGFTLAIAILINKEMQLQLINSSLRTPKLISLQSQKHPSIHESYYHISLTYTAEDKYLLADYYRKERFNYCRDEGYEVMVEPKDNFIIVWDAKTLKEVDYWRLNQSISKDDFLANYINSNIESNYVKVEKNQIPISLPTPNYFIHLNNFPYLACYSTNITNTNLYIYNTTTLKLTEFKIKEPIQNHVVSSDGSKLYFSLPMTNTKGRPTEIKCIQFGLSKEELNNNIVPRL